MESSSTGGGPQVLVLGMPRTGTTSLRVALRQVGYNRHYYWDTLRMPERKDDVARWSRLVSKKFDASGGLLPRPAFDAILGNFTSLADLPCSLFAEDLISAYPDAKVILSVRDSPDAWYASFNNTVWNYQRRKNFPQGISERFWAAVMVKNDVAKLMTVILHKTRLREFPTRGQQWYIDHNEMVRRLVPKDRLLEFNAKDGWEPLCEFLGVEQPAGDYPKTNSGHGFRTMTENMWVRWRMRKTKEWLHVLSIVMGSVAIIFCLLGTMNKDGFVWPAVSVST